MTRDDRPSPDDRFAELLSAFDEALAAGKTTESEAERLRQSDPELAERLDRAVRSLERLEEVRQLCGGSLSAVDPCERALDDDGTRTLPEAPRTIDRFRIVRELGRGGFGIVYLVYDPVLEREIALKVPRPEVLVSPELKQRFLREAKAAAGLNHPHIVAVYETGQVGPICWIAEEYCQGASLAERLNAEGQPIRAAAAARVMADLADALEHAHQRAVLHRDLKPGNVILEQHAAHQPEDEAAAGAEDDLADVTAKLTDFGLAKLTEQDGPETRTGAMLGTPSYMAPEQADAAQGPVGPATDVYGLGTILYEMLTGRPPYRAATSTDTLRQVLLDDPVPPTRLRLGLAKDLEAICLKCLERQPRDRYASAGELAADLRRFLAGEPTRARPLGPVGRAFKWSRYHPTGTALLVVTVLLLAVILMGGSWQLHRLRRELATNEQLRQEAELRQRQRLRDLYRSDIQLAQRLWQEGKLKQTRRLLGKYLPDNGSRGPTSLGFPPASGPAATDNRGARAPHAQDDANQRDFAWHYLWQRCHGQLTTYRGHTEDVCAVVFSPDGRRVATAGHDGTARLFAARSGRELAVLRGHEGEVNCVAFTPDSRVLATGADDGLIKLWDVETHHTLAALQGHQDEVLCLAISPDGQTLASGGMDHVIRLWQLKSRQSVGTLEEHTDWIRGLAFSPDGRTLASCSDDGTLKLWDVSGDEARLRASLHHGDWVLSVAFSLDGAVVATGCKDRYVRLRDADTGEVLAPALRHEDWVRGVALSGDGKYLAAVGTGHLIKLWSLENIASPKLVRNIPGHSAKTWSVAFAPDSKTMATVGGDGLAKRWRVGDDPHWDEVWELPTGMALDNLVASRDGATIALVLEQGSNAELRLWDRSRRVETAVHRRTSLLQGLAFSPDDRHLAFIGSDGSVEMLAVDTLDRSRSFAGPAGNYGRVAFHPDGKTLASSHGRGTVRLWDLTTGTAREVVLSAAADATLLDMLFSPDGRTLAAYDLNNKTVILYDLAADTVRDVLPECDETLAFSGDGALLATGCQDRTVRIWDAHSARLLQTVAGHNGTLQGLAFSPDGRVLASAPRERPPDGRLAVKIWAVDAGDELLAIPTDLQLVAALAFTPDGQTLIVGGERWEQTDKSVTREPLVLFFSGGDPASRGETFRFRPP